MRMQIMSVLAVFILISSAWLSYWNTVSAQHVSVTRMHKPTYQSLLLGINNCNNKTIVAEAIYYMLPVCQVVLFCFCPRSHHHYFHNRHYHHFLTIITQAWTLESTFSAIMFYNWEYYRKRSKAFCTICCPDQICLLLINLFSLLYPPLSSEYRKYLVICFGYHTSHFLGNSCVWKSFLPFVRTEPICFYISTKCQILAFQLFL